MAKKSRIRSLKARLILLLRYCPQSVRARIQRRLLNLQFDLPKELVFKVAETKEELACAFRLVHETYLERNLTKPSESGLRISKFQALPTTTTLIAKYKGEVVATISVIGLSHLGLPIGQLWDIGRFKANGKVPVEMSSCAIKKDGPFRRGFLLFPLLFFTVEYLRTYYKADYVLISTDPRVKDFYSGLLGFRQIDKSVLSYNFVNGAKAFGQYLDIGTDYFHNWTKRVFRGAPKHRDLHQYFTGNHFVDNMVFPERKYHKCLDPVMSIELLNYFFNKKEKIFPNLTEEECHALLRHYHFNEFLEIIGSSNSADNLRKEARFAYRLSGTFTENDTLHRCMISNVSKNGISITSDQRLQLNHQISILVKVNVDSEVIVRAVPQWSDDSGCYGCKIENLSMPSLWQKFVSYLEYDLRKPTDDREDMSLKSVRSE